MLIRNALLIALSAGLLAAADGNRLLPPDLKHVTPKQFNDLLSKTFGGDKPQLPLDRLTLPSPPRLLAVQPNRCVIPLQNYQAEDRDPNMSLRLAPEAFKNGMAVPPPIPACNK